MELDTIKRSIVEMSADQAARRLSDVTFKRNEDDLGKSAFSAGLNSRPDDALGIVLCRVFFYFARTASRPHRGPVREVLMDSLDRVVAMLP